MQNVEHSGKTTEKGPKVPPPPGEAPGGQAVRAKHTDMPPAMRESVMKQKTELIKKIQDLGEQYEAWFLTAKKAMRDYNDYFEQKDKTPNKQEFNDKALALFNNYRDARRKVGDLVLQWETELHNLAVVRRDLGEAPYDPLDQGKINSALQDLKYEIPYMSGQPYQPIRPAVIATETEEEE